MKTAITLFLVLWAGVAWGNECDPTNGARTMEVKSCDNIYLTDLPVIRVPYEPDIKQLAESGQICEVYGHWWNQHVVNNGTIGYPDSSTNHRTCKLCNLEQLEVKEHTKWVDK